MYMLRLHHAAEPLLRGPKALSTHLVLRDLLTGHYCDCSKLAYWSPDDTKHPFYCLPRLQNKSIERVS